MTSIVIWLNREEGDSVWAASDSRLTGNQSSTMSDSCPKLFSIPIQVHTDQRQISQLKVTAFGFCYAGSSLIGQTSYIKLTEMLSKLLPISSHGGFSVESYKQLPSLSDIANLLKILAEESLQEMCDYKFNIMSKEFVCSELAIFGYCYQSEKLKCYSLKNSKETQREFEVREVDLYKSNFYLLGDRQQEISRSIDDEYNNYDFESLKWWRAPYYALENIVSQEQFHSIGGKLQLARAYRYGADIIFPVTAENVNDGLYQLGGFITTPRKMMP